MKTKIIFSLLIALICAQYNTVSADDELDSRLDNPPIKIDKVDHWIMTPICSLLSVQMNLISLRIQEIHDSLGDPDLDPVEDQRLRDLLGRLQDRLNILSNYFNFNFCRYYDSDLFTNPED